MSIKYTCCIDKERLNGSIETLTSIEDCLNTRNLSNDFIDIEELIKNTNFNHNNCINDYKDKINYILEELELLKKDINTLSNSMNLTVKEFSNVDEIKTNDIDNIFSYFNSNIDSANLSVNNNLVVANNVGLFKENMSTLANSMKSNDLNLTNEIGTSIANVNTVPIGLGIGAAGVTASIGAVVVDSMTHPKHHDSEYDYYEEEKQEEIKENPEKVQREEKIENRVDEKEEEVFTPYFANRDRTKIDKFYDEDEEE